MFIIGIIVYFGGLKNLRMTKDIAGVLFGRFILSPLVVWLLSRIIPVPELMLSVFIIQASMPVKTLSRSLYETTKGMKNLQLHV